MKAKTKDQRTQSAKECVLLSAAQCAQMCGISRRSWFRYVASGKTPACVRLNDNPKWRREDIELWIYWNLPARREFEARKEAEKC